MCIRDSLLIDDFEEAVRAAAAQAGEGDVVLLSPASTSFDKFSNFMELSLIHISCAFASFDPAFSPATT